MSDQEESHAICERLRKLYLRLEDNGQRRSPAWSAARALDDRIRSSRQLDADLDDAKALLAQYGL